MQTTKLNWLPEQSDWPAKIREMRKQPSPAFDELVSLARVRLDFLQTTQLDRALEAATRDHNPASYPEPLRLAILSSSTTSHLLPGIQTGLLRRGLWAKIYTTSYGQYQQELLDPESPLHAFAPNVVVFAFDAGHLIGTRAGIVENASEVIDDALHRLTELWNTARERFAAQVIQQSILPVFPPILGNNESRLSGSPHRIIHQTNVQMHDRADQAQVDIISLDQQISRQGLFAWHDPALWHRAKQEISPAAGPMYGDLVARLVAARRGKSAKCLVLDLDNTLWGGVIGDDGLDGIILGQGSALGEAYSGFQAYARMLSQRGVILAVCSKNDEANAAEAFEKHPEMVLKRDDIACFVANWNDKASNLREIATRLNIGIDSLVFVDDNPFEREQVRRELPAVSVPELPDDPASYAATVAAAGYFESVAITAEDKERNQQYRANAQRESLQRSASDMGAYLRSLEMELRCRRFDQVGLQRIVQLINKTNQFNLTTRRYTEAEVQRILSDKNSFGLQLRLLDRLGDNGVIAIIIGKREAQDIVIDTWLMSCRVLGRGVEQATLSLVAKAALELEATRLIGIYKPTAKNGMVRDHYSKLGFEELENQGNGESRWALSLKDLKQNEHSMKITEEQNESV